MSRVRRPVLFSLLALALGAAGAAATPVSQLAALHRDGQTFLTWKALPGTGWRYRIYSSDQPIRDAFSMENALVEGEVGDSTWCDQRLYRITGVPHAFRIDEDRPPLATDRGLFVVTPGWDREMYYAVSARRPGGYEDFLFIEGQSSLAAPVGETVATPQPVFQRTVTGSYGIVADVYTMWTTHESTPMFDAMSSTPSLPYDCAVVKGQGRQPLVVRGHGRGGHFLVSLAGISSGNWVLSVDDYLPNPDVATFYFGYHEGYNPNGADNPPPMSGYVHPYTYSRVLFLMDWVESRFTVDTDRVYAVGSSMGGSMALFLALHDPERFAAAWSEVPKVDLSDFGDATLSPAAFAPLWGEASVNLPTDGGLGVYQRLSGPWLASTDPARCFPPVYVLSGRNDEVMGWAEKVRLYDAFASSRRGGFFFWDERTHAGNGAWDPSRTPWILQRYRRNLSYPAFSDGNLNSDAGDGSPGSGAAVGTINGHYDWDPELVDRPDLWAVTLRLRDLATTTGTRAAPPTAFTTVTPRRLQQFVVEPGRTYLWDVKRLSDGAMNQWGTATADALGLLSIPGVMVHKDGSWLRVRADAAVGVALAPAPGGPLSLQLDRAPVVGRAQLAIRWPGAGESRVTLLDVSGRALRTLHRGPASGTGRVAIDAATLAPGVYFALAEQDGTRASLRFVVLR